MCWASSARLRPLTSSWKRRRTAGRSADVADINIRMIISSGYQHLPPLRSHIRWLAHYVGQVFLDAAAVGVREEGADDVVVG